MSKITPHKRIPEIVLSTLEYMVKEGYSTQEEADTEILRQNKKYEDLEELEAKFAGDPMMELFKSRFNS
jgi:hypothetical protein